LADPNAEKRPSKRLGGDSATIGEDRGVAEYRGLPAWKPVAVAAMVAPTKRRRIGSFPQLARNLYEMRSPFSGKMLRMDFVAKKLPFTHVIDRIH
jgi:hypothetical protein